MNKEQQKIWEYLNKHALGVNNKKSSNEIKTSLGLESGGPTNEHIRDLIRDMILKHSCCIGSLLWGNGFWVIQTEDELYKVVKDLNNRADGVRRRADALMQNWEKQKNG